MDDFDSRHTQTIVSDDKNQEHFIDNSETDNKTAIDKRHCVSLPLYYDQSELCTFDSRRGMECMPLRTSSGPYHYHVNDQTKSLQELQNEVGALLEFRDLVIETFPDLKNKMASISASSTITGVPSSSSLASRREWEPGIRVRRKLTHKETADMAPSSLTRSRSNSHSGKKEPKSGEGNNGSVIQDSGFSTETSSSKETHSATSTSGATASAAIVGGNGTSGLHRVSSHETEDELWNLLDVIHRKSTRLREEMEHLQHLEREKSPYLHHLNHHTHHPYNLNHSHHLKDTNHDSSNTRNLTEMFQLELNRINKEDMHLLRKERDRLLDKLAEMEAETIAGRIKTNQMEDEVNTLHLVKRDLEEQLRAALSQKLELNTRLHDLLADRNDIPASSTEVPKSRQRSSMAARKLSPDTYHQNNGQIGANTFSAVIVKSSALPHQASTLQSQQQQYYENVMSAFGDAGKQSKGDYHLGRLDGLVSSPNRCSKVRVADSRKIAAILLETNIVELQRHLLTITVQNQALTQKLEQTTKSKIYLIKKLDKAKEEIDDLKFQLEERNIELEGTKAQLRVLSSKSSKSDYSPEHYASPMIASQVSTPSMKAMIPLAMDEMQNNSSSTESAHDHAERDGSRNTDSVKRRPSKIPLPGSKGYLAPKPPTGRNFVNSRSPSGPPSNKSSSLSKSTSSLNGRYETTSSMQKTTSPTSPTSPNLYRPESAQSIRKDTSLGNSSRNSSSIPISTPKMSPTRTITSTTATPTKNSPLPKTKRESFTSKVRHMDSLSRIHGSPTHSGSMASTTTTTTNLGSPTNNTTPTHVSSNSNSSLYKSSSKKDLSSSFSIGQSRDRKQQNSTATSVRRSSTSVGSKGIDLSTTTEPVEKITVDEKVDAETNGSNRDLIREYLTRTRAPPAIFQPTPITSYNPLEAPQQQFVNIAYKHPHLLIDDGSDGEKIEGNVTNGVSSAEDQIDEITINSEVSASNKIANNESSKIESKNHEDYKPMFKINLFNNTGYNSTYQNENGNSCKLIGNVKPNLIKTWEQLNATTAKESNAIRMMNYPIEFNRQDSCSNYGNQFPFSTKEHGFMDDRVANGGGTTATVANNESFIIRRAASKSSDHFYDSIDNESFVTQDDDEQLIASLCDDEHGGEAMADYLSLIEKKEKLCWSVDSCN